ncbi:hypothetical protein [Vibrio parahaemolyticus]
MAKISKKQLLGVLKDSVCIEHGNASFLSMRAMKAIALASSMALAGCASPAMQSVQDSIDMSYGQKQIAEVNGKTFTDIVDHSKSGLYKHPLFDDKVVVFEFSHDKDASDSIRNDLSEFGIDPDVYDWNRMLKDMLQDEKSLASRHIQDPNPLNEDINYSYINQAVYKDFRSQNPVNEDIARAMTLFVMMHEAGHSVEHQQVGAIDAAKLIFSQKQLYMLENSSDVIGSAKTINVLHESGASQDFINEFLDEAIRDRKAVVRAHNQEIENDSSHNPTHRTVPSLALVKSLYNKDPEQFHRLTNSDIEKMAEVIATKVIDYDFNKDFVEHSVTVIDRVKTKDDLDRVNQQFEFGLVTEQFLEHIHKSSPSGKTESINQAASALLDAVNKSGNESWIAIASELSANTEHYHMAFKDDKLQASRELLQKGLGEMTINDVKQQRMIAYVDKFDGFTHDMMSELENSNVWVNNERTNDKNLQVAQSNMSYGI